MRALLLGLLVGGCSGGASPGASPAPEPTQAVDAEPEDTDPTHISPEGMRLWDHPFSADALREGLPVGTLDVWRIEQAGEPTLIRTSRIVAADARTATFSALHVRAEDGEVHGDPSEFTARWEELRDHASFPADAVKRTQGTVTVPAGTFEGPRFEATRDASSIEVFHFARELPGPPVSYTRTADGQVVYRMTLLHRRNVDGRTWGALPEVSPPAPSAAPSSAPPGPTAPPE